MSSAKRRFWMEASVVPQEKGDYGVALDGRLIKLPGGHLLVVAARALADAIAEEWRAIPPDSLFDASALPLTRMTGTMIERVAPDLDAARGTLLNFGLSDLLLFREETLRDIQSVLFDPPVDAFSERYGVRPRVTFSIVPDTVETPVKATMSRILAGMDAAALASLGVLVPALGSLILGIGLLEGWVTETAACDAAFLDERTQMRRWGEDTELLDDLASRAADVETGLKFWQLSLRKD
ncbi:ATP12 family protein [Brytella acorum]|uniref:ATPase n=1 Tax=Brytella acorum TaxID=2959299 RepID=A0AA35VCA5_9PROT|nr:ATP12 family protein [Brytella acorum]MDF3623833.1 hypothetical protein [Brytella acorum]CAI9120749.1 hypothetical protein LMG32879_001587 [Brytella acorum]